MLPNLLFQQVIP